MLDKPEYGWTTFGICDEHQYRLSYLTDVAVEWLGQAIHGLKTLEPFAVHGYCEPCRMICTVCYWDCYIVLEGDENFEPHSYKQFYGVSLRMIDFCKQLYSDISENLESWVHWDDSDMNDKADERFDDLHPESEEEFVFDQEEYNAVVNDVYEDRRKLIQDKLDELKKLIEENEEHFGPGRGFF